MQVVLENVSANAVRVPPNDVLGPEGAVCITFWETGPDGIARVTVPIVIPALQAIQLGMQIIAASKHGETNGAILPPTEPVYGGDDPEEILREISDLEGRNEG